MPFAEKLVRLRKEKKLTQLEIAAKIGVGIAQLRQYERGNSSPTLEVIKNMARTFDVSADELVFDDTERSAASKIMDKELLAQFEIISQLNPHDVDAVKTILESMIVKSRLDEVMPQPQKDMAWEKEMRKTISSFRRKARNCSSEEIEDLIDEAVTAVREEEKTGRANVEQKNKGGN